MEATKHPRDGPMGRIGAMPGVDAAEGLRFAGGKPEAYARLLGLFAKIHRGDVASMRAKLAAGDTESVGRLAHTLKGLAAMLGAGLLSERAANVEMAAREAVPPAEIAARIDALEPTLIALLDAIAGAGIGPPQDG